MVTVCGGHLRGLLSIFSSFKFLKLGRYLGRNSNLFRETLSTLRLTKEPGSAGKLEILFLEISKTSSLGKDNKAGGNSLNLFERKLRYLRKGSWVNVKGKVTKELLFRPIRSQSVNNPISVGSSWISLPSRFTFEGFLGASAFSRSISCWSVFEVVRCIFMLKQKQLDIKDTNLALFGTEIEYKVKENSADTELAWKGVDQEGLFIWRIEKFKVVTVPNNGRFYSGDSYIVLNNYKVDKKLLHDVHFWLGRDTSQDEAGTAAYKTTELDTHLKGKPVQYREVMGYESALFMSYFPNFVVSDGGIDSGFKHVQDEKPVTRLYHVKGRKTNLVIRQVPTSHESMNSGDVFIVDNGLSILQWNGSSSSGQERAKSMTWANALASERKSAKVTVFSISL